MEDRAYRCRRGAGHEVSNRQGSFTTYNTERTGENGQWEERMRRGGKIVVMRDAKVLLNQKHGVVSVDHTCSQCLHPAAAVAVITDEVG